VSSLERTPQERDAGANEATAKSRPERIDERIAALLKLGQDRNAARARAQLAIREPGEGVDDTREMSIVIYLDTDEEHVIESVVQSVDAFVEALGYDIYRSLVEQGSFFRQSWARLRKGLTSDDMKELSAQARRAMELQLLDLNQAEVDNMLADAFSKTVESVADATSVCVRVGSIFLIKYLGPEGPVVVSRTLSPLEMKTLEKHPEIQRIPHHAFDALALAISSLDDISQQP
jgi:hypothetical protein